MKKFTLWDTIEKKVIHEASLLINSNGDIQGIIFDFEPDKNILQVIEVIKNDCKYESKDHKSSYVLMEYIEVLDINGNDIRYKDIVEVFMDDGFDYGTQIGTVEYNNGSYYVKTRCIDMYQWATYEVKIIGNEFETPELMLKHELSS